MLPMHSRPVAPGTGSSFLLNVLMFALFVGTPLLVLLWVGLSAAGAVVVGPGKVHVLSGSAARWLAELHWMRPALLGGAGAAAGLGALLHVRRRPSGGATSAGAGTLAAPERYPDEYVLNVPTECLERAADPTVWSQIG